MKQSRSAPALTAAVGGLLVLGMAGPARADHRTSVDITIATPGVYTRFATGPRYPAYQGPPGYYAWAPPPVPVYVPGYWTYYPPAGYGHDRRDHRRDYDHDGYRGPRHHHDRGRHEGWRRDDRRQRHHDDD